MLEIAGKTPETIYIDNKEVEQIEINNDVVWSNTPQVLPDYFYVKNEYSGQNTMTLTKYVTGSPAGNPPTDLSYSKDKINWTIFDLSQSTNTVVLEEGEKLYMRSSTGFSYGSVWSNFYNLRVGCSENFSVCGDITTLVDYTTTLTSLPDTSFIQMFNGSSKLISANFHCGSVETVGNATFSNLFVNCVNLTTPPDFSTIKYCTKDSFSDCFNGCTSLQTPADFSNVSTIGNSCFNRVYNGCSSLTKGGDFSKITNVSYTNSFARAFYNCSSLTEVVAPTVSSWSTSYFNSWLYNVSSFGVLYNYGSATIPINNVSGCPNGWIIQPMQVATISSNKFLFYQNPTNYSLKFTISNYSSIALPSGLTGVVTCGNNTYNFTSSNVSSGNVTISNISSSDLPNAGDTATMSISYSTYDLCYGSGNVHIQDSLSINGNVKFEEVSADIFNMTVKVSNLDLTTLPSGWSGTVVSGSKSFNFNASKVSGTDTITVTNISRNNIPNSGDSASVTINTTTYTSYYDQTWVVFNYLPDYLYIKNEYSGQNTFTLTINGSPASSDLSYSKDKINWTAFDLSQSTNNVSLNNGEKLYLRSSTNLSSSSSDYFSFDCNENYSVGGNGNSLIDYNSINNVSILDYSFYGLFENSSKLINISNLTLPSLSLGDYSYQNMFKDCSNLVQIITTLPATTLGIGCYSGMFSNCVGITKSPILPATTLSQSCYEMLFSGCSNLNEITIYANDISATDCLNNWVQNVSSSGIFYNYGSAIYTVDNVSGIPIGWKNGDYFYIENTYAGQNTLTLTTTKSGSPSTSYYSQNVEYSKDKINWTTIPINRNNGDTQTITMNQGETVYFRNNSGYFNYENGSKTSINTSFSCSEENSVGGVLTTLLDYNNRDTVTLKQGCFLYLLHNNTTLTNAKNLIFKGGGSANRCYIAFFYNCNSLTSNNLPDITVITSVSGNFDFYSFYNSCSSLTEVWTPNIRSWSTSVFNSWLRGVAATGIVHKPTNLTIPTNNNSGVPTGWTTQNY